MTALDASVELGRNPKYIYHLWRRDSDILLKDSVKMMGGTLLITREGFEHLETLTKIESDLAINSPNGQVYYEVMEALLSSQKYNYT